MQYYAKSNVINYEVVEDVTKVLDFDPIKILFVDLKDRSRLIRHSSTDLFRHWRAL